MPAFRPDAARRVFIPRANTQNTPGHINSRHMSGYGAVTVAGKLGEGEVVCI
jgi:hypothetical protein